MKKTMLNPIFFEKTKDGEVMYDVSSRLMKDRVIYLDAELDQESSSQILSLLFLLDREDDEKPISLWLSSPGGIASGFFAIYDMIHRIKAPVRTVGHGEIASAAAMLLACGTPGMRFIMPSARVMIHEMQVDGLSGSNAEIEITTNEIKRVQDKITEVLARHTGHTKTQIKRHTKLDKWFNAEEAVSYGIVDKILEPKKKIPELKKRESKKGVDGS